MLGGGRQVEGQKLHGEVGGSGDTQLEKMRKKETKHRDKHDVPGFEGKTKEEGFSDEEKVFLVEESNEAKNMSYGRAPETNRWE